MLRDAPLPRAASYFLIPIYSPGHQPTRPTQINPNAPSHAGSPPARFPLLFVRYLSTTPLLSHTHTPTVCSARTCARAPDYFYCVFSLRLTALGPPGQNARCTHPPPWRGGVLPPRRSIAARRPMYALSFFSVFVLLNLFCVLRTTLHTPKFEYT